MTSRERHGNVHRAPVDVILIFSFLLSFLQGLSLQYKADHTTKCTRVCVRVCVCVCVCAVSTRRPPTKSRTNPPLNPTAYLFRGRGYKFAECKPFAILGRVVGYSSVSVWRETKTNDDIPVTVSLTTATLARSLGI